jgi:hypothetical protein
LIDTDGQKCIGRESNPGLADILDRKSWMATANFTTKPPMLLYGKVGVKRIMLLSLAPEKEGNGD